MRKRDTIGIDFGTTNTYITLCPAGTGNKIPLYLSGKSPAVDSVILYSGREGADPDVFPVIGEMATVTYGQAGPEEAEREGYSYHANFKPGIARNPEAARFAADFFRAVLRDARLNGTPLEPEGSRVIIGAPSEAGEEFRATLRKVAAQAGLGEVEVMDEPKGTLLTDLGSGRFPLSDVLAGYLAVDFGGGTCDFAFMRRGEVVRSWGDMELGGRLFDDLFYQWFGEENPSAMREIADSRRDFYVWSYACRRLKEDFSETVSRNPKAKVTAEVGRYGAIRNMTREAFLERARSYTPSRSFLGYQEKFGVPVSERLRKGGVDLLAWFAEALEAGLKEAGGEGGLGEPGELGAVSLSGGSSRWFFVRELCARRLPLEESRILSSLNPFGTISEGLSLLPALQEEFRAKKDRILEARDAFFREGIMGHAREALRKCSGRMTLEVLAGFFDESLAPELLSFAGKPVTLDKVERRAEALWREREHGIKGRLETMLAEETRVIYSISQEKARAWLATFGLAAAPAPPWKSQASSGLELRLAVGDELAQPLFGAFSGLVYALAAAVSASVCGGAGLALLASGPAGLVAGALGGAALGGIGLAVGRERLLEFIKRQSLPGFVTRAVITEASVAKVREELRAGLAKELEKVTEGFAGELQEVLGDMVKREIEELGIVHLFLGDPRIPRRSAARLPQGS
ncbi:MAG: rod shape-determining protein [Deltaproteobacteria bacterium]|jgi:hypothetical protein|nr:rod shape-determining protein [Deltaproteobacteria bacterium]